MGEESVLSGVKRYYNFCYGYGEYCTYIEWLCCIPNFYISQNIARSI